MTAKYLYSILIEKTADTEKGSDERASLEMFVASVRESIEDEIGAKNKTTSEAIQRTLQRLRGSLTPYLTTPLKSDQDDIERSLQETLEEILQQRGSGLTSKPTGINLSRILEIPKVPLHKHSVSAIKQMLKNGKSLLTHAQTKKVKSRGNIFSVNILVDDHSLVPHLYGCVVKACRKHAEDGYSFVSDSLSENVFSRAGTQHNSKNSLVLHFTGSDVVAEKVNDRLTLLLNELTFEEMTFFKKSFHLGFGSTFQIHFDLDLKKNPPGAIIASLVGEDQELENTIFINGSLFAAEKIL